MRLFVNVYASPSGNIAHTTRAGADKAAAHDRVSLIEVEAPFHADFGTKGSGSDDPRFAGSAEELRARYPLTPVVPPVADAVTVGDLNSAELGTGARKSAGKPDWSQLPWWVVPDIRVAFEEMRAVGRHMHWGLVLALLGEWQRGTNFKLDQAAAMTLWLSRCEIDGVLLYGDVGKTEKFPVRALEETVRVLEFGAKKYAKGNWAKGMSWSVCFNSAMSHLTKILVGEKKDEESGLPHRAHLMCNLIFLIGYRSRFPEGDDRQPEFTHREDPTDDIPF